MPRRLPTSSEMRRFEADAVDTMRDRCAVLRYTDDAQDARGMPTWTYVPGEVVPCGYSLRTRREVLGGAQVPVEVSSLRLPLSEAVTTLDRIKLTTRAGRELASPIIYEITDLRPGVAQWMLDIKQAADPQRGL
ncbi:hypothetical protein K2Z83_13545 [Oscillochloris sp. ZM17-4]|uniref:hypothetical protein n=1 Tax=Oscillochloris sp. ZM17-4 TaxID=2866714 RepID=UPI001C7320ED|nr:hypothetical protein [Oscillochloris sp. ZM17-4]MBX0328701.1 hypothetical protein [Oscillochloris sp. ZM17-4]